MRSIKLTICAVGVFVRMLVPRRQTTAQPQIVHLFDNSTTTAYEDIANHPRIVLRNSIHDSKPVVRLPWRANLSAAPLPLGPLSNRINACNEKRRPEERQITGQDSGIAYSLLQSSVQGGTIGIYRRQQKQRYGDDERHYTVQACCDTAALSFGTRTVPRHQDDLFGEGTKHSIKAVWCTLMRRLWTPEQHSMTLQPWRSESLSLVMTLDYISNLRLYALQMDKSWDN